ncbi:MAG: MFS transporter [Gemmatimonas sp.]|uniref:NTP/NDP exchange transporter n=1 Tax=Gemmatimonas sp. UBA7669 TaxID=1946568 RepID=UPI0025BD1504|nr:MFS transporter [Gemmatimonas sp. UBA7669]MBA3918452.1 MFS transporter [Gemmatimonas sp.]
MNAETGLLARLRASVGARPGEGAVLVWATTYYFLVLCAYYVIRPIRDDMGAASGAENLAWLFTGTMVGMLLVHPLYTSLVSKLRRRQFIGWTYRFFILNLVVFYLIFRAVDASQAVWVGRVFFIWTSIFNLFVVSVFWSLLTDVFRPGQGKRLFGVVAVGGTVGAMLGASITTGLVGLMGPLNLMLVSALILELAVRASHVLDKAEAAMRLSDDGTDPASEVGAPSTTTAGAPAPASSEAVIGGGMLDGIKHILSSPYLLGIASLILFYTISSTFLYFQQVDVVARTFGEDRAARTQVFGAMDIAVNALTLLAQLFVTGRFIKWLGVGAALAFLPLVTLIGFGVMGFAPTLAVLIVFQVARRAGNFAIQRPAREALFTVLGRSDKYKAKNFSDTFVYRLGDQVGAWSYTWMGVFGLGLSGLAFSMVPLSLAWLALAGWLGRQYLTKEKVKTP